MGNIKFAIKDEVEKLLSVAIEVNIAVALCSNYAVNALQNIPKSCKLRVVTGVDLPTPLEVLRALKSRYKKKARIYAETFFHPKVYIFRLKNKELVAYIGSGNFTEGGLSNNIEVFYKVEDQDECRNLLDWFENVFNKSLCITDDFLIEYKEYSRKWAKEENKRTSEIKSLLSETNEKKRLFDSLKEKLKEIRDSQDYKGICNERTDTVSRIKEALDYENGFENIDIDKFLKIKELGNIRQSYKKDLKRAVKSHKLRDLFLMLCNDDESIEKRYRDATEEYKIRGCDKNMITKVLAVHDPQKYMLWNGVTEDIMDKYDIRFERGTKEYQKYGHLCEEFKEIISELKIKDFVVLDLMMFYV